MCDSKCIYLKFGVLFALSELLIIFAVLMKVHPIKWKSIELFAEKHARSKVSIEKFNGSIKSADWKVINDIKETFG